MMYKVFFFFKMRKTKMHKEVTLAIKLLLKAKLLDTESICLPLNITFYTHTHTHTHNFFPF